MMKIVNIMRKINSPSTEPVSQCRPTSCAAPTWRSANDRFCLPPKELKNVYNEIKF